MIAPKEIPMLFSAPMVRALMAGTKTQTRRITPVAMLDCKPAGAPVGGYLLNYQFTLPTAGRTFGRRGKAITGTGGVFVNEEEALRWFCEEFAPWRPGDVLWVRETFRVWRDEDSLLEGRIADRVDHALLRSRTEYRATSRDAESGGWRPSIFMPRWLSRLSLRVKAVRIERLQDISEEDAVAEGVEPMIDAAGTPGWTDYQTARGGGWYSAHASYMSLWTSINGPGSWEANPFVWVVTFERMEGGAIQ